MKIGSDFEAYFTMNPNEVVVRGLKQHVQVTARTGEVKDFMLEDAAELARLCAKYEAESQNIVRLRSYWGDNSHGNGRAVVHIIVGRQEAMVNPDDLKWPSTTKNSQTLDVTVRVREENVGGDRFEANAEHFYRDLEK